MARDHKTPHPWDGYPKAMWRPATGCPLRAQRLAGLSKCAQIFRALRLLKEYPPTAKTAKTGWGAGMVRQPTVARPLRLGGFRQF